GFDPLNVLRGLQRHVVVPGRQMPRQRFHIEGLQLDLGKAEGNRRAIIGGDTLIGKLFEEGHIAVAVDRVNHRRITTGAKTFDFADDGLIVLMMEGGIFLLNIGFLHALLQEIEPQNFIGGAWIHVVSADQVKPLFIAPLRTHQKIYGWRGLLIDRGTGVDDVFGAFLTLILYRVEEETIVALEHGQHGFPTHRRPASKYRGNFILLEEFFGFLSEQVPVRRWIFDEGFHLATQNTAGSIDFVNGHQHHFFNWRLADGHGATQRMQDADFHGVCRLYRLDTETQKPCEDGGTHDGCQLPPCPPHMLPCTTHSIASSHVFASLVDRCSRLYTLQRRASTWACTQATTTSNPVPARRLVNTNGLLPRMRMASRSITCRS